MIDEQRCVFNLEEPEIEAPKCQEPQKIEDPKKERASKKKKKVVEVITKQIKQYFVEGRINVKGIRKDIGLIVEAEDMTEAFNLANTRVK